VAGGAAGLPSQPIELSPKPTRATSVNSFLMGFLVNHECQSSCRSQDPPAMAVPLRTRASRLSGYSPPTQRSWDYLFQRFLFSFPLTERLDTEFFCETQ
jgi:hypothetical protein